MKLFKRKEVVNQYDKQAKDFLDQTNTTIKKEFLKFDKHFSTDKFKRCIFNITLTRGTRKYTFAYGSSLRDLETQIRNSNESYLGHQAKSFNYPTKVKADTEILNSFIKKVESGTVKINLPDNYYILACLDVMYLSLIHI